MRHPGSESFRSFRVHFCYTHIETYVCKLDRNRVHPGESGIFLICCYYCLATKIRPGRHGTGPADLVTGLTVGIFGRRCPQVRRDCRTPLRMRQVVTRSILGPVHWVQVARHWRCAHVVIQAVRRRAADSTVKNGPYKPRHRRRDHRGRRRGRSSGRRALKAVSLYSSERNVWRRFQT